MVYGAGNGLMEILGRLFIHSE